MPNLDGWTFMRFEPRAWRVAVVYVVVSIVWIYFSDRVLLALVSDEETLLSWSVYKGFGFVIFTALMMLVMFHRDLSQLRRSETEVEGLNRLLVARSKVNQAMVQIADLDGFLGEVCRILVDQGQVDMACIGRLEPVSGQIHQVACSREGELLFPTLEGVERTYVSNNLGGDALMAPWREATRKKGFRSAAFLPIHSQGKPWGVLSVYSRTTGFFHAREVSLLEEVGKDISFALDIVARTRARDEAEKQVRNEKEFSDAILESLPGIVYFYDERGGFLRWNRNFELISGYTEEEMRGLRPLEVIHEEDRELVQARVDEVFRVGSSSVEARLLCKDGTGIAYFFTGRKLEFNGKACLVGVGIDISEQKQATKRIAEQAALLDKSHDAIVVCDLDHRVQYWNRSAEQLYGWTAEQAAGVTLAELMIPKGEALDRTVEATRRDGEWTGEMGQVSKSGKEIIVESRWTLVRDEDDTPRSILTISTDITERKRLETQILRTQRMESIGTLAGGIAHDMNNLLSPIVMGVDLLKQGVTDVRLAGIVENIGMSAERGRSLVKQVLSFARGVDGSRVTYMMDHVVKEVESIIDTSFPKNIRVVRKSDSRLWPIVGDPTQFNQVLLNLAVNARDAMPSGGQITITTRNMEIDEQFAVMNRELSAGRYVVLEVTDEGSGMPAEVLDHLFEPFYTTKPQGQGTGLGLSTVLAIVHSHGGTVTVYSEVGRGSVFKVYIPAQADTPIEAAVREAAEVAADVGDDQRGRVSTRGAARELPRGNGELVLVVDDEASILNITRQTLETYGYRVVTAQDGAQAMVQYADHRADVSLVLTDMMMPIMDGPALVKALRRIDPDVRVIGTSGLQPGNDASETYGLGFERFIEKPFSAGRLLTVIAAVLRE